MFKNRRIRQTKKVAWDYNHTKKNLVFLFAAVIPLIDTILQLIQSQENYMFLIQIQDGFIVQNHLQEQKI